MTECGFLHEEWREASDKASLPAMPVVSVHMLAYKHGKYLADAIEGVIAQITDFPIELIIGEDCSPDDTRKIALDYQQRYPQLIRVIYSERNVGAHQNFERVLRSSKGPYIAFCEGDDYWVEPRKLQMQVDFLAKHPDYGAVHGDHNHLAFTFGHWRVRRGVKRILRGVVPSGDIRAPIKWDMFVVTCTLTCRATLVTQFARWARPRFAAGDYLSGDWPMIAFVAQKSKVGYIDTPLATYRRVPGSAMQSGPRAALNMALNAWRISEDLYSEFGGTREERAQSNLALYRRLYRAAFEARDVEHFRAAEAWLSENDSAATAAWRARLCSFAVARPWIHRIVFYAVKLKREIGVYMHYEKL